MSHDLIYSVWKPTNWSSFDVVKKIKLILKSLDNKNYLRKTIFFIKNFFKS